MEDSKKTLKALVLGIMLYAVPFVFLGVFLFENKISFLLGLLLGLCVAIYLAIHLYRSLDYCLALDPESAEGVMRKKVMIRYFIMLAAVLITGILPNIFHPVGVFVGLMGLKISAYFQPFIHK